MLIDITCKPCIWHLLNKANKARMDWETCFKSFFFEKIILSKKLHEKFLTGKSDWKCQIGRCKKATKICKSFISLKITKKKNDNLFWHYFKIIPVTQNVGGMLYLSALCNHFGVSVSKNFYKIFTYVRLVDFNGGYLFNFIVVHGRWSGALHLVE